MTDQHEYIVVDDLGQLMGVPTRSWDTESAAFAAKKLFDDRIEAMRQTAEQAKPLLASNVIDGRELTSVERSMLREQVQTWDVNKHRSYSVKRRRVGPWEAVS